MNLYIKVAYDEDGPLIAHVWGDTTIQELIEIEEGLPESVAGLDEDSLALFTVYSQEEGEYEYVFRGIE